MVNICHYKIRFEFQTEDTEWVEVEFGVDTIRLMERLHETS